MNMDSLCYSLRCNCIAVIVIICLLQAIFACDLWV
jgi:hypothetical protein